MKEKTKEMLEGLAILLMVIISYFVYIFSFIWCAIHKVDWYFLVLMSLICIPVLYFFTKGWIEGLQGYIKRYYKDKKK